MWSHEDYGNSSPGEKYFKRAWADLTPQYNDSFMDWGIGVGRAAQKFKDKGLRVEGLDIAKNANRAFKGHVHIGTIWNPPFPKTKKYLLGYCTDVMEHIPEPMVGKALSAIKRHTTDAVWFSVATFPDKSGAAIGETLHMTVRPARWWAAQFARVFPRFRFEDEGRKIIVVAYCEPLRIKA